MAQDPLPLLPTTVIGSHATPSWLWTAMAEIDKGNYGPTDIKETYDDAVNAAILDQERAGVVVAPRPAGHRDHRRRRRLNNNSRNRSEQSPRPHGRGLLYATVSH